MQYPTYQFNDGFSTLGKFSILSNNRPVRNRGCPIDSHPEGFCLRPRQHFIKPLARVVTIRLQKIASEFQEIVDEGISPHFERMDGTEFLYGILSTVCY